jgi:pimeloyl-ACP methyl ester carboxylesterase
MTTAISLAIAVLAGSIAYFAWAARAVADGMNVLWALAGIPLAALAIPALLTLLWLTLSWVFRAERPPQMRLSFAGLARLYWREVLAIAESIPRMILYRWLMRDPAPARAAAGASVPPPVLLLHGVLCNAGVWHGMRRRLAARGIAPIYALSYGPPLASIDLFADQAAAKIDAILAATGAAQVVIVGHSMGGLVARAYLGRYGGAKVRRIITIGTPHAGSVMAHMFPGVSLSQMRPRNAWLDDLDASGAAQHPPIVSLWSWHDSMVAPQTSSVLERAENIALMGIGHNALLADPAVAARVAAEIERAAAGEPPLAAPTPSATEQEAA